MGWNFPSWGCDNTAPMAYLEASVSNLKGRVGSGIRKTGAMVIACFTAANASVHSWVQFQVVSFFHNEWSGHVIPEKFLIKRR